MKISVGGATSEIEAEAQKKLINEKELKLLLDGQPSKGDLMTAKTKLYDLLGFYDRIIRSIHATIETVNKKNQLTHKQKQDMYIKNQEKDLSQAKREKAKFKRYLQNIIEKIGEKS